MAKKKTKERTIDSFSKDVLVEWISRYCAFKPQTFDLLAVEQAVKSKKILDEMKSVVDKIKSARTEDKLPLHLKFARLQKQFNRLRNKWEVVEKSSPYYEVVDDGKPLL